MLLRCDVQECCTTLIFFLVFVTQHGPGDLATDVLLYLPAPGESKREQDVRVAEGCRLCDLGSDRAPDKLQSHV